MWMTANYGQQVCLVLQSFYNYIAKFVRHRDGADNTIEENSSVFSLIRMC